MSNKIILIEDMKIRLQIENRDLYKKLQVT
jgi:hypothetical protein